MNATVVELKDRVLDFLKSESEVHNGEEFAVKAADLADRMGADVAEIRRAFANLVQEDKISTRRGGPQGTLVYVGRSDYWPATETAPRKVRSAGAAPAGEKVLGAFYCVECGTRNTITERVETRCPRCNEVLLHPGKFCNYCGCHLDGNQAFEN